MRTFREAIDRPTFALLRLLLEPKIIFRENLELLIKNYAFR